MRTADFDYELPSSAIAQTPAEPRDAARMLVAGEPLVDTWVNRLPEFLQPGDLLVVNASRVRAARLVGKRPTGGRVELLFLRPEADTWIALARPARKLRAGMALSFEGFVAEVRAVEEGGRVRVSLPVTDRAAAEALIERAGRVPYPPYVTTGPEDPERYQTVYAREIGSAAAPTAGLHFTVGLIDALAAAGVARAEVSLDIGLDTFRPISTGDVNDHVMHREEFSIPEQTAEAVERAQTGGGRVVAVGTTVVRALESAARGDGTITPGRASTDLFVRPGYQPRIVDALLTNFHMPRSSLVVMIAALVPQWRRLYEHALAGGYRFLSFGDAMFVPEIR
jgi:S-adenosylmethionine:tRNA ribosyltransferase-isomerase